MSERCLSDDTIVDFMERRGNAALRARVEEHASRCAQCREVLSSLARSGAPVAVASSEGLAAGTRVGRYEIVEAIGAGGMGVVYAAHDPELDRMVAVKVLRGGGHAGHPELQLRLRREARAMAQLVHPNVVAVHDVGAFGDRIFIAMEYVPGETLLHWVVGRKTPGEILAAYRAAGAGLAAAHAAGLVHRDFKPENVLIGRDGRPRVGDFGLARSDLSSRAATSALATPGGSVEILMTAELDARDTVDMRGAPWPSHAAPTLGPSENRTAAPLPELTEPGTLLGTPYYMAPELYRGADADARSDQFAFCVALYTALAGERPLMDHTFDASTAERRARKLHELASERKLPRRARAAIQRGLASDPAARFASLTELLDELAPRSRRWLPLAGVAALALIAITFGLRARSDERCTGGAVAFATAWNPGQRAATSAALFAVGKPFALAAAPAVGRALDDYAARWAFAHDDACRATRVRGEQTEALLALRMTCLERRRQEARALVASLARADAALAAGATDAVSKLSDLAGCADVAALQQVVPPPDDPAVRQQLAALAPALAEARVAYDTGAYPAGLARAATVNAEARRLGYKPFEAEAAQLEGQLAYEVGDLDRAERQLNAAVWAAEVGRVDDLAARAWISLVFIIGYDKAEFARGLAFVPRATAALARLGAAPELEANLERSLGAIDAEQSHLDAAVAHFEKAVAITEHAFGPTHPTAIRALGSLGMALMTQNHFDRAIEIHQRVLAASEARYGAAHPAVARALHNLGNAHAAAAYNALAEQEERRALAIRESALGPVHPDIAANLADLARAVRRQGRIAEALVLERRSVAMGAQAFGPEHPAYAQQLLGLGITLTRAAQWPDADAALRHAEAIFTKLHGADHPEVLGVVAARGDLEMAQHHWAAAVAIYQRVITALTTREPDGDALHDALVNLGQAYVELHQPKLALPPLERLARQLDQLPADLRIAVELHLARALWDSHGDRARALSLAREALAVARGRSDTPADTIAEIERWLAGHRT